MKLGIGKPVRGNKFYPRPEISSKLLELLQEDANILLSAPRRVGKTSIILNLYDKPPKNYLVVYVDTEKCESIQEYFKELLNKITDSEIIDKYDGFGSLVIEKIKDTAKRVKTINVGGVIGIEKEATQAVDYYEEFELLINEIELKGQKIVLLVDEFPVTVENIKRKDDSDGSQEVKRFLQMNRTIRLNPKLSDKISFIYTGSIGLFNVVSNIGMTEDINDLNTLTVPPLESKDALKLLASLASTYKIIIDKSTSKYIIEKVEWLMPFYIQTLFREVRDLYRKEEPAVIDNDFIDQAFNNIIDNVNIYLDHFRSRLSKVFKKEQLNFSKELLHIIADNNFIQKNNIPELAAKHKVEKYSYVIDTLKYDGYIDNSVNENEYRFNSPIFKQWWVKYGNK